MPRRHSSLSIKAPYKSTFTNNRLYRNNLDQENAVIRQMEDYINIWVYPQYINNYNPDNTQLQQYDDFYGPQIENELQYFAGYDLVNIFASQSNRAAVQMLSRNTLNLIKTARKGFEIQSLTAAYKNTIDDLRINITALQKTIIELGEPYDPKKYHKPLIAEVEAEISLDIRYYLYIKEFGVPEDGYFDPVKLSTFVYVDADGNQIENQESVQYADGINLDNQDVVDQWVDISQNPFIPRPNYSHWT